MACRECRGQVERIARRGDELHNLGQAHGAGNCSSQSAVREACGHPLSGGRAKPDGANADRAARDEDFPKRAVAIANSISGARRSGLMRSSRAAGSVTMRFIGLLRWWSTMTYEPTAVSHSGFRLHIDDVSHNARKIAGWIANAPGGARRFEGYRPAPAQAGPACAPHPTRSPRATRRFAPPGGKGWRPRGSSAAQAPATARTALGEPIRRAISVYETV